MRFLPAWGWSALTIAVIVLNLSLGAGGPEGRALSRSFYWPVVSLALVFTLFAYLDQYHRPTKKLALINMGGVVLLLYLTLPIWHFGIELPTEPGGRPIVHWWINGLVFVLAVVSFYLLNKMTAPLEAGERAVEDKRDRLTI